MMYRNQKKVALCVIAPEITLQKKKLVKIEPILPQRD